MRAPSFVSICTIRTSRARAVPEPDVNETSGCQQIDDGRALCRAAASHRTKAGLVGRRAAAAAFGDIEDDRDARAVELIAELRIAALGCELSGNGLELERDPTAVELLGVQQRRAGKERRGGRVRGPGDESVAAGAPGLCTRRDSACRARGALARRMLRTCT